MAKAPVGPTAGRRQAGKPAVAHASIQAAHGPRALAGALSIPIEQIAPDPDQPRRAMDEQGLRALAASLREYGVLQPLLVREDGYLADERARYRIVAGGRRYAAALLAGLPRLPVVVRDTEGAALRVTQLIENVQRQDLTPMDEARAFQELMDAEGIGAEELGKRLHISGQKVRDRLLVLGDHPLADAVQRGQIGPTVAAEIARLPDEGRQQVGPLIDAGETIDQTTVREIRDTLKAAGVANLRAKGGGRPRKERRREPEQPSAGQEYQCDIDTQQPPLHPAAASTTPRPSAVDGLQATLGPLNVAVVVEVARFGAAEGWSCAQLVVALEAVGARAE